ncbi:MAG: acetyl-CoA carboxylase biotin carboxyl carrier protein [Candidatus Omnitrophica bacterium]|nr:acetyl-CoA carboxylase biotin carboxyl carrier protein [Candidatus Omnitrophota bacterium]MDD5441341.1 acetyl-CoA carboxylase biotin carboxyl carrier protein [Candidatus Omnitrophota bacterium]
MELKQLKALMKFMNDNELAELEVEDKETKIRFKKRFTDSGVVMMPQLSAEQQMRMQAVPSASLPEPIENSNLVDIKSPMVGTFYAASSPGAKPYAAVGQSVSKGDVVCIVEAMKLMNEIKADVSGTITNILVENGQPVEFGQVMFKIEPV